MRSITTISAFLRKESSFDALYNIMLIIIVCSIGYLNFELETTIAIGVGIILACLTDLPGNRQDKINTTLFCIPIFALTSFSIALSAHYQSSLIILLLATFGFIYTLLVLFGSRIGVVGNLSLIVASFTIGLRPTDPAAYTIALSSGAAIYFIFSLLFVHIHPHRSLRYAIEEVISDMSSLIAIKVDCYDESKNLTTTYKKLSLVHIQLSDKLEQIRSLLLREKQLLKSEDQTTQIWLSKLYCIIDLYEQLMAIDHDYETTRELLKTTHTLPLIRIALKILASDTAKINLSSATPTFQYDRKEELLAIITQLNSIQSSLSKDQKNLINSIASQLTQILDLLSKIKSNTIATTKSWLDHSFYRDFVAQKVTIKDFINNITFKSPIFLYAIRMGTLLGAAGWIGYFLPEYRYASWIILTIILVARPTFNVTQKRNFQRICGSIIGILLSIGVFFIFKNEIILLVFIAISLYLYFLFSRVNYLICVIFVTVAIVLFQSIYEGNTGLILGSRFAFTLIGALLAILGCFAIPINYFKTIKNQTHSLVSTFNTYLHKIQVNLNNKSINYYEIRLLRKSTQHILAQCFDALEQLEKDPIIGKRYKPSIHQFQSLAYRINALLIGIAINIHKSPEEVESLKINDKIQVIQRFIYEAQELSDSITNRKTSNV